MQGGERHEAFTYPDEQWTYYVFADKFGWTPDQVDNLSAPMADWLLSITALAEEVRAERLDKEL
jgi:hypothetical protein